MKRTVFMTVTLQMMVELDIDEENERTKVGLVDARYAAIGNTLPADGAAPLSKEYLNVIGAESTKLGARWLLDKLDGKLEDAVPQITQPAGGASA